MPSEKKELVNALRSVIKILITREVRLLRLKQMDPPSFLLDGIVESIQETKREIIDLVQPVGHKERSLLLKRLVREAVHKEIDRSIQLRKNRCFRCLHMRFYDETGKAHEKLPYGKFQIEIVGCDAVESSSEKECRQFVEKSIATSLQNYLNEVAVFYEVGETFEQFKEIWEDYFASE